MHIVLFRIIPFSYISLFRELPLTYISRKIYGLELLANDSLFHLFPRFQYMRLLFFYYLWLQVEALWSDLLFLVSKGTPKILYHKKEVGSRFYKATG